MKWFLFAMFIAPTGGVENWQDPKPFATKGECSKELLAVRADWKANQPEIFRNRVLVCDEVDRKDLQAANEYFFQQFGEVPFK